MSRVRVSVAVLVLVAAGAVSVSVAAQDAPRPNFSGKWTPVPEKSRPANPGRPVPGFTIVQDGQKFTVTSPVGGAPEPVSTTYVIDDVEHEMPGPSPTPAQPADRQTYQAAWNKDQLVITLRVTRVVTVDGKETKTVTAFGRAYSLDAEGFLILESTAVRSTPPPPATLRVVYRKEAGSVAPVTPQATPATITASFAGRWQVIQASPGATPGAFFCGANFTATQDDKALTVARTTPAPPQTPGLSSVFNLDGSESRNSTSIGGKAVDLVSKATWNGSKLVVVTNYNASGFAVEHTQTWSLDSAGNLKIEQQSVQNGRSNQSEWTYKKS